MHRLQVINECSPCLQAIVKPSTNITFKALVCFLLFIQACHSTACSSINFPRELYTYWRNLSTVSQGSTDVHKKLRRLLFTKWLQRFHLRRGNIWHRHFKICYDGASLEWSFSEAKRCITLTKALWNLKLTGRRATWR